MYFCLACTDPENSVRGGPGNVFLFGMHRSRKFRQGRPWQCIFVWHAQIQKILSGEALAMYFCLACTDPENSVREGPGNVFLLASTDPENSVRGGPDYVFFLVCLFCLFNSL